MSASPQLVAQRLQIRQCHLILGAIGSALRVDDVIETSHDNDKSFTDLLCRGARPPALVSTGATSRNERQIQLPGIGHEVEHQRHIGEERSVERCRHGLTIGELAMMIIGEGWIDDTTVKLTVVPMEGWRREAWLDETTLHLERCGPERTDALRMGLMLPDRFMPTGRQTHP